MVFYAILDFRFDSFDCCDLGALFFDAPVGLLFYVPCSSHWPWSESWWVSKSQKLGKSNENSANTFPFNIFQPSQMLKNNPNKNIPSSKHPISSNFQFLHPRISSLDPGPGWMPWKAPQRVRRAGSEGRRFRGAQDGGSLGKWSI